jgi:hypothetical protein
MYSTSIIYMRIRAYGFHTLEVLHPLDGGSIHKIQCFDASSR